MSDEKVMGRPVREVLGLEFDGGQDYVGSSSNGASASLERA